MPGLSRAAVCGLLAALGLAGFAAAPAAQPLSAARAPDARPAAVAAGGHWYRDEDYYYDSYERPAYRPPPPPPPVRIYRYAPPPAFYEPPVYGWIAPPRPASCGKYRYWNGEYCADARFDPPYTGPRW